MGRVYVGRRLDPDIERQMTPQQAKYARETLAKQNVRDFMVQYGNDRPSRIPRHRWLAWLFDLISKEA